MPRIFLGAVVAAIILMATGSTIPTAQAQSITITRDESGMMRLLESQGYRDIVVVKRSFARTTSEACKGNDKFRVKVTILGKISSQQRIGSCGRRFSAQAAVQKMENAGYKKVEALTNGDVIIANGCLRRKKYELTYNLRGDLINRARRGPCRPNALSAEEVGKRLSSAGYDRIRFTDDQLPKYIAEACRDGNRLRLELNRRAEIRSERNIGNCQKPVNADRLAVVLENQGYERVKIVQGKRLPYLARGCSDGKRLEMIVNRYGEVLSKTSLGDCRRRIDPADLASYLESEGYDRMNPIQTRKAPYRVEACKGSDLMELVIGRAGRIRSENRVGRCNTVSSEKDILAKIKQQDLTSPTIKRTSRGHWVAEACKNKTRVEVRYSKYGEPQGERNIGSCASAEVRDVLDNLRNRGARNVTMFIQGCFNNNTYHWIFDDLGNRVDRRFVQSGC